MSECCCNYFILQYRINDIQSITWKGISCRNVWTSCNIQSRSLHCKGWWSALKVLLGNWGMLTLIWLELRLTVLLLSVMSLLSCSDHFDH